MRNYKTIFVIAGLVGLMTVAGITTALAASPAYGATPNQGRAGEVVPDSYVVVLKDGVSPDQVAKDHGVARRHSYKAVFNGFSGKVPPGQAKNFRTIHGSCL